MKTVLVDVKKPPVRKIWRRNPTIRRLGRTVFRDVIAAGWLTQCAFKPSKGQRTSNASTFYALADIEEVERRLLSGEYPEPPKTKQKRAKKWATK
jgi:alpha-ketoglutarate-dependent taurine dioxygenase